MHHEWSHAPSRNDIRSWRLVVATKTSTVARSLKLRHVDLGFSALMGDLQETLSALNLGPFVGVDSNLCTDRLYNRHRADTDVKWIKPNLGYVKRQTEQILIESHTSWVRTLWNSGMLVYLITRCGEGAVVSIVSCWSIYCCWEPRRGILILFTIICHGILLCSKNRCWGVLDIAWYWLWW